MTNQVGKLARISDSNIHQNDLFKDMNKKNQLYFYFSPESK